MIRSRGWVFAGMAAVGAAAGWYAAQRRFDRSRRDLFSPQPLRRLGALGFLAGQHGVAPARLLRDYVAWEPQPMLRRRGEAILRRLEAALA